MSNHNKGRFGGRGYYIALILCAVAIGISGYLYYRNTNEPAAQQQNPVTDSVEALPQDVPAAATNPTAELAMEQLPGLRGCEVHSTVILVPSESLVIFLRTTSRIPLLYSALAES